MAASRARILSVAHDDSGVDLISLAIEPGFSFRAGQYLNVVHSDGTRIPMSIASAPAQLPELELHFRPLPGVAEGVLLSKLLEEAKELAIEGPFGDVCVDADARGHLLLIAGGSGISQCRAIVDQLDLTTAPRRATLVWSVSRPEHLYRETDLARRSGWLDYFAVIDAPGRGNAAVEWVGTTASLPNAERVIVSGSPGFVYAVVDALVARGVDRSIIESDVFAYAPR